MGHYRKTTRNDPLVFVGEAGKMIADAMEKARTLLNGGSGEAGVIISWSKLNQRVGSSS